MKTLPFDHFGLTEAEIATFHSTYNALKDEHKAKFDNNWYFNFTRFDLFKHYQKVSLNHAVTIGKFHIAFPRVSYDYPATKGRMMYAQEFQAWGIAILTADFGNILIKPENLEDKFREFIHPVELDFENDPGFSKKFYVLANDKKKAEAGMSAAFRNAVLAIREDDFLIEIQGKTLIIGNRKPVSPESVLVFVNFLTTVQSC